MISAQEIGAFSAARVVEAFRGGAKLFEHKGAWTLKRAQKLGTVDLPTEYAVQFEITPTARVGGWTNIIHITATGGNCCDYGDRIPAIWFYDRSTQLLVIDGHGEFGDADHECPVTDQLPLQKTTTVRVEMLHTVVDVYYNDVKKCTERRADRKEFSKAMVWAADPWYNAAKAQLARMQITRITACGDGGPNSSSPVEGGGHAGPGLCGSGKAYNSSLGAVHCRDKNVDGICDSPMDECCYTTTCGVGGTNDSVAVGGGASSASDGVCGGDAPFYNPAVAQRVCTDVNGDGVCDSARIAECCKSNTTCSNGGFAPPVLPRLAPPIPPPPPGLHLEVYHRAGGTLQSYGTPLYTTWGALKPFATHRTHAKDVWYSNDNQFKADIPGFKKNDQYILRFSGMFTAANRGAYQFKTRSDDGSQLWIDEKLIVNNDGDHGPTDRTGRTAVLAKGTHQIVITFYEYVST